MADSKVKILFTTDDSALVKSQKNAIAGAQTTSKEINRAYQDRYDKQKQTAREWEKYEQEQNKKRIAGEKQTQKEIELAQKAQLAEMLAAQKAHLKEIDNARKQADRDERERQKEMLRQQEQNAKEALRIVNNRIREEEKLASKRFSFKNAFSAGAIGGATFSAVQSAIPYIGGLLQKGEASAEIDAKLQAVFGANVKGYKETEQELDALSAKYHIVRDDLAEQYLAYAKLVGSSRQKGVLDDAHAKIVTLIGLDQELSDKGADNTQIATLFAKTMEGAGRGLSMYFPELKGVTDQTAAFGLVHNRAISGITEKQREAMDPAFAYRNMITDLNNKYDEITKDLNKDLIPAFEDLSKILKDLGPYIHTAVQGIDEILHPFSQATAEEKADVHFRPLAAIRDIVTGGRLAYDPSTVENTGVSKGDVWGLFKHDFGMDAHAEGMVIDSPLYSHDKYGKIHVQGEKGREFLVPEYKVSPAMARYLQSVILSKNGDPSEDEIGDFGKETGIHHALDFIAEHGLEAAENALEGAGAEGLAGAAGTAAGSLGPLGALYMAYNAVKNHDRHAMEYLATHSLHGSESTAVSVPIPHGNGMKYFGGNAFISPFHSMTGHAEGAVVGGDPDTTPINVGLLPKDAKKAAELAKENMQYQLGINAEFSEFTKVLNKKDVEVKPVTESDVDDFKRSTESGLKSVFKDPIFALTGDKRKKALMNIANSITTPTAISHRLPMLSADEMYMTADQLNASNKVQFQQQAQDAIFAARHQMGLKNPGEEATKDNTKETKKLTETMRGFLDIMKEGKSAMESVNQHYGASVGANGMLAWQQPKRKNATLHDILGGLGKAAGIASMIPGLSATIAPWLKFGSEGLGAIDEMIPSFAEGGRANFGSGTLTVLHGWENIVPDARMPEVAAKFNGSNMSAENTAVLHRIEKAIRSQRLVMQSDPYGNSLSQDSALSKNALDKF